MNIDPNETLASFINRRTRVLTSEARRLRFEIKKIYEEIQSLEKAANASGVHFSYESDVFEGLFTSFKQQESQKDRPRASPVASQMTIQTAALNVLSEVGRALTATELLPLINEKLGIEYPRSSLSPQLSRLKQRQLVRLIGNTWALTAWSAQSNEASGDLLMRNAPEASEREPEAKGREAGPGGGT